MDATQIGRLFICRICVAFVLSFVQAVKHMREKRDLEFKSGVSHSFLKTVSAFSNIGKGIIRFGVDDDGKVIGLSNLEETCLNIENKINDSITPNPNYKFEIDYKNKTIDLVVYKGLNKPYLYKSKAYKRNDSSTIEMDNLELQRLILEGKNLYFEELSYKGKLSFETLGKEFQTILNINLSNDILKTLGLLNASGEYNNASALLADKNDFPGIDIIRFGNSINEIMDRETIMNTSILSQYHRAYDFFEKYYQYELIDGSNRKNVELVPANAFREAIANALIHRVWDDTPNIRISMFKDKIIVSSPGGLPSGISKEEYLDGQVSKLRNPTLANVFFRLKYIEMFGTGILRIKELYKDNECKPDFKINENSITITLPVLNLKPVMTLDESKVYEYLNRGITASRSDLIAFTGFGKDKVFRILKSLSEKGYIKAVGEGRSRKYSIL